MKASLLYNQLINLGWTMLGFAPVVIFWEKHYQPWLLLLSIVLSLLPFFIPASALINFLVSRRRTWYIRIGVKKAQGFTQNGALINRHIRKRTTKYKLITNRKDMIKHRNQMLVYEKYHLACLVFFTLSMLWAGLAQAYQEVILILIANIIYNVYPILIQHYNKLRLHRW